jgi:hypothetical protein
METLATLLAFGIILFIAGMVLYVALRTGK